MKPFFTYMLRCADGRYYVGHTDELETRVAQHEDGTFGGFTSERRPVSLVWSTDTATREEALELELRVKRWSRAKKEALIRGDWAALKRHARGADRSERAREAHPQPLGPSTPREADASRYARDEREGEADRSCPRSVRPERPSTPREAAASGYARDDRAEAKGPGDTGGDR